jgi:hypothetical protein
MVGGSIGKVLLIFKHMGRAAYSARTMSHASENLLCIGKRFPISSPQHNSVSENWLKSKLTLTKGIQDYVPHKKSTPKYKLPWITSAIKLATIREIRRIQAEPNHPCHTILPDPRDYPYELRRNNSYTVLSRTERHKQSFITRSSKYI